MKDLLQDKTLENRLRKHGYVKLSLFNRPEIDELNHFFNRNTPERYKPVFTTFATNDTDYKQKVDQKIKKMLWPKLVHNLKPGYIPFWGNFMVKAPGSENMLLHADWAYVDESTTRSFNVWMPLIKTSVQNGTLWVIPKSHLIINSLRGIKFPREYYQHEKELMFEYARPLNFKPGEVIIYDHRMLHFSLPNLSDKPRLAVTLIVVPQEAQKYYHYYEKEENKILRYMIREPEFLLNLNFFNKPTGAGTLEELDIQQVEPIKKSDIQKHLDKQNVFKRQYHRFVINKALKQANLPS